jgi:small subunit ribosomal protein S8
VNFRGQKELNIVLKYEGKKMIPVLTNLKCLSKPGVRLYSNSKEIPQVLGGLGITIISTSKGMLNDYEARTMGVGGEILCMIW